MTIEQVQRFSEMGYTAAQRVAARIDAGNANEAAATSVACDLKNGMLHYCLPNTILTTQIRCGMDLSSLLALPEEGQQEAVAAFVGGCMLFLEENSD